jgi:hypothetical protein
MMGVNNELTNSPLKSHRRRRQSLDNLAHRRSHGAVLGIFGVERHAIAFDKLAVKAMDWIQSR